MANIRADVSYTIRDGSQIIFRSPCDCSEVTGLKLYYTSESGTKSFKEFAFADAHGNNVGDIEHLFAEDVVVKVILDVTKAMAYVQNADTNSYLEDRFDDIKKQVGSIAVRDYEDPEHPGCFYRIVDGEKEWINPPMDLGVEYRTTERHNGEAVYLMRLTLGELLNTGIVTMTLPNKIGDLIELHCTARSEYYKETVIFPVFSMNGLVGARLRLLRNETIEARTFIDYSGYVATVTLKYTGYTEV